MSGGYYSAFCRERIGGHRGNYDRLELTEQLALALALERKLAPGALGGIKPAGRAATNRTAANGGSADSTATSG